MGALLGVFFPRSLRGQTRLLKAPGTVGVRVPPGEPELIEEAASPQGSSCVWNKEGVGTSPGTPPILYRIGVVWGGGGG